MTTVSAWPSPAAAGGAEVDVDLLDVGPGQVVDRDGVGAAQRVDVDRLDAVEVHRDVADVAEQPGMRLPLAEMSMFSLTLAPLNSSVSMPRLALDRVAAVARVPDEGVVARAEQRRCRCRGRR